MATGKSNKWLWIVGSLILVGGGIGAYFLLRKPKEDAETDEGDTDLGAGAGTDAGNIGSGSVQTKQFTFPFTTTEEGNKFRAWVIKKDPAFAKSIDLDATGSLNSYVQKAWDKYGKEYTESQKPTTTTTTTNKVAPSKDDIKIIVSKGTGSNAEESWLNKRDASFVKAWANAWRNKNSTKGFTWANQIYSMKTGNKLLTYNPIGLSHEVNKSGQIAKAEPNWGSSAVYVPKGLKVGKARAYKIDEDENIWLYFPDNGGSYKWGVAKYFNRISSSSFDGMGDQNFEPASSFDAFEPSL